MDTAKKATFEKYIVLGLLLVFGVALWGSLRQMGVVRAPSSTRSQAVAAVAVTAPASLPQAAQDHLNKMLPPAEAQAPAAAPATTLSGPLVYTAQELRDPFKSLLPEDTKPAGPAALPPEPMRVERAVAPPSLTVQGMWWGEGQPKAIINGRVYGVGDRIEGAVITAIGRAGVTIEYQGSTTQLTTAAGSGPGGLSRTSASASRWR